MKRDGLNHLPIDCSGDVDHGCIATPLIRLIYREYPNAFIARFNLLDRSKFGTSHQKAGEQVGKEPG
jgi:hypothetical protein